MITLLPALKNKLLFALGLLFCSLTTFAQCPTAASCTPGTAPSGNHAFGMGIMNVTFGSISNSTGGVTDGYQDYSCTMGDSLIAGVATGISITTNINANENVRVWIDYDNNGSFDPVTELAFTSDNRKQHNGFITIPGTAVTGQPLRMRVSADYVAATIPTPCSTPQYSQVEDYAVTIAANTAAPVAAFAASQTTICASPVTFNDQSQNTPTSWQWSFGDGNNSTFQNPTHTYSNSGTYSVTLIVCNSVGCDTLVKTAYITNNSVLPIAAQCTPHTSAYCCDYGITSFGIANFTNSSQNGVAGYEDFTCTSAIRLIRGQSFPVSLKTSDNNNQDTRIFLDINNNGIFEASEKLLEALNQKNPSSSISIPLGTTLNTPLRMRVISDFAGGGFTACSGVTYGQAEDYTVIVDSVNSAPIADFTTNYSTPCDSVVRFTDRSFNNATGWKWYFGDGDSATVRNPLHKYDTNGIYSVVLIVCNSYGCDTLTKRNIIEVDAPCPAYCTPNYYDVMSDDNGIARVRLTDLDNQTVQAIYGYFDYTNLSATIVRGSVHNIDITSHSNAVTTTSVWIDFNRNGIFEDTERVVFDHAAGTLASTIAVPSAAVLGRTRMRIINRKLHQNVMACIQYGKDTEVEDYTIIIEDNSKRPAANFKTERTTTCDGLVKFKDESSFIPTSWAWDFGDGTTSSSQNPSHTYTTPGTYNITLRVCNSFGCSVMLKSNYISFTPSATCNIVNMPVTGAAPVITACSGTIYDSGGPTGRYSNNESSIVTIAPYNASSVTLNFTTFRFYNNDFVTIYDGASVAAPVIGVYAGNNLPNGGTVTAISGAITLKVETGPSANIDGFAATWSCTPISAAPVVDFMANLDSICSGEVHFKDKSTNNPSSWIWDFGDGTTSTQQNPVHIYAAGSPADYTVKLTAANSFGADSVIKTNAIHITNPCWQYCSSIGNDNSNIWIKQVKVGNIDNRTSQEDNGYGNYTFLETPLLARQNERLKVVVQPGLSAYIKVIVASHGNLNNGIEVFGGISQQLPTGEWGIDTTIRVNPGKQRMRVFIIGGNYPFFNCMSGFIGEAEDYSVEGFMTLSAPVSRFSVSDTLTCSGAFAFSDSSLNIPDTWLWHFGDSDTSSLQNPMHTYTVPGTYTVTLITCNSFGCDTLQMPNLVRYDPAGVGCDTVKMKSWPDPIVSNLCNGKFYDSGGPDGNYVRGENGVFSIRANGAENVSISFNYLELGYNDHLIIYNGPSVNSPVIAQYTYGSAIAMPYHISSGNSLTVRFYSNGGYGGTGWDADWHCNYRNRKPDAKASFELKNDCNGNVQFTDQSAHFPATRLWDFGDGVTSTQAQVIHQYAAIGNYQVKLKVCNNFGCDSLIMPLVNSGPISTVKPMACNLNSGIITGVITKIKLNTLEHQPPFMGNKYNNFSCVLYDTLRAYQPYNLLVNSLYPLNVGVWIDYNNNAVFDNSEQVMSTFNDTLHHSVVTIPANAVRNKLLRLRVGSKEAYFPNSSAAIACPSGGDYTQYIDYAVIIHDPVGVKDKLPKLTFSIYPNPSTGLVTVKTEAAKVQQLEVLNVLGQVLQTKQLQPNEGKEHQLNLNHLPKGVYMIRVTSKDGATGIEKLILD